MNCPICNTICVNKNKIEKVWNDIDSVLFCNNCNLYLLEKIPSKEKLDNYYKSEYHHYSKIKYFTKNIFRKFRSINQFIYIKSKIGDLKNKKILEIGACDGLLLNYFKKNGCEITGVEPSPIYKKKAKKKYGIELLNLDFFSLEEKFDLIIMSHVIEHLPDLNLAMIKLKNLLNDDGYLFIEVPNSPKPNERDEIYINNYLTTPHIYNFTEKSFWIISQKNKMKLFSQSRFFYDIEFCNIDTKEKIAEIFLKGSGLKLKYLFPITFYLLKNIINPKKSYKKIEKDTPYLGFGDNIRIILKK